MNACDATSLIDVLEHQVIPEFYEREQDDIPHRWISRVKASMVTLTPQFSVTRMLHEYIEHAHLPAANAYAERATNDAALAKEIRNWTNQLRVEWQHIRLGQLRFTEDAGQINANVGCWLDSIPIDAVQVQLYAEANERLPALVIELQRCRELPGSVNGFLYCGAISAERQSSEYALRVVPYHPAAIIPIENQCIHWND